MFYSPADYTYNQTKSPLHEAVLVYFYVFHLVMERNSHQRWSVQSNVSNNFAEINRKRQSPYYNEVASGTCKWEHLKEAISKRKILSIRKKSY